MVATVHMYRYLAQSNSAGSNVQLVILRAQIWSQARFPFTLHAVARLASRKTFMRLAVDLTSFGCRPTSNEFQSCVSMNVVVLFALVDLAKTKETPRNTSHLAYMAMPDRLKGLSLLLMSSCPSFPMPQPVDQAFYKICVLSSF